MQLTSVQHKVFYQILDHAHADCKMFNLKGSHFSFTYVNYKKMRL